MIRRAAYFLPVLAVACTSPALAQMIAALPEEVLISAAAVPGATIDPDKIAVNTQTIGGMDLTRFGSANVLGTLGAGIAGISFADAQNNPLQPNLVYRGFEASPLAGDAQGLAVYANGVRLNQPFGDTLNWDLIPDVAIDRLTLEGSNPVFGLNALAGSVSIQLKNGFTFHGVEAEGLAGSFGRYQGNVQAAYGDETRSLYVAGNYLTEDGWRAHSPSRAAQGFADFGWRNSNGGELHLNLLGADSDLTGNGPAPVELLTASRSAVFTYPDRTRNTYGLANIFGSEKLTEDLSLQVNAYVSHLKQRTMNGDASEIEACGATLCLDGDDVTDESGDVIPDFLSGDPYAQLNKTGTDTTGFGGALQVSYKTELTPGRMNQAIAGFAFDGGHTRFAANSELGALAADRGFQGPGIVIDQADGSIAPVKVTSDNRYYGLYAADIVDVTERLSLNIAARFNYATIDLKDELGVALTGSHSYSHVNPAAGFTYNIGRTLSFYGGYAMANRAPTPAEFSCADPAAPCSLTNFFVADPALKQVVAQTVEAGFRGQGMLGDGLSAQWHAGVFRTDSDDDIMFVASPILGRAFFRNIGDTRRHGVESSLDIFADRWSLSFDYSYTGAMFQSDLTLNSPENPLSDSNGQIQVTRGNRLPNVPEHLFKMTAVIRMLPQWSVALAARAASGMYLQGDEANLNPKTGAYVVLDIGTQYDITEHISLFATLTNAFDADYETFGTFAPTSEVPIAEAPGASDPRSLSPGAPRAIFGGLRIKL